VFFNVSPFAGTIAGMVAAHISGSAYAGRIHQNMHWPNDEQSHPASDDEIRYARGSFRSFLYIGVASMTLGVMLLSLPPVNAVLGGHLIAGYFLSTVVGYLTGAYFHRAANWDAYAMAEMFKTRGMLFPLLIGEGRLFSRTKNAQVPGQKKLDDLPADMVAEALRRLGITLEGPEERTLDVDDYSIDPRAVVAITRWLKANIGTATEEQLDAALLVLERHLTEFRFTGKDAAIKQIMKDIRDPDNGRRTVDQFEGALAEIVTSENISLGVSDPGLAHLLGLWHRAAYGFLMLPYSRQTPHHVLLMKLGADSKYPSYLSTVSAHVRGAAYEESLVNAVAAQLKLRWNGGSDSGYWQKLVGQERYEEGNDNEIRRVYFHTLTPGELKVINNNIRALRDTKAGMTETEYEAWGRTEEAHSLFGDIREYYPINIDDLIQAPYEVRIKEAPEKAWSFADEESEQLYYLELDETFNDGEIVESRTYFAPDTLNRFVGLYSAKVYNTLKDSSTSWSRWHDLAMTGLIVVAVLRSLFLPGYYDVPVLHSDTLLFYLKMMPVMVGLTWFRKKKDPDAGFRDNSKKVPGGSREAADREETVHNDATRALLRDLSSSDPETRFNAIITSGKMGKRGDFEAGDVRVVEALIAVMNTYNYKDIFDALKDLKADRGQYLSAAKKTFSLTRRGSYAVIELDRQNITIDDELLSLYQSFLVVDDNYDERLAKAVTQSLENPKTWDEKKLGLLVQAVKVRQTNTASIIKSYRSRSTKGKSLLFLILIFIGYIAGIIHKILNDPDFVLYLYALNAVMVFTDIMLYFRNRTLMKKEDTK
jgi:hypothetical protein